MKRSLTLLVAAATLTLGTVTPALGVAPANDLIENATAIGFLPFSETLDTTDAHADGPRTRRCGDSGSVFYKFKATADVQLQVDTIGSDYDTTLAVYQGPRRDLEAIGCKDDSFGFLQTSFRFDAREGRRYWFVAGLCCGDGRDGGGELSFRVQVVPLDELTVEAIVTGGTIDGVSGDVSLEGTVECSDRALVRLYLSLRQRHGDFVASLDPYTQIDFYCDGAGVNPWVSQELIPQFGVSFVAGDARVRFFMVAFDGQRHPADEDQNQVISLAVV